MFSYIPRIDIHDRHSTYTYIDDTAYLNINVHIDFYVFIIFIYIYIIVVIYIDVAFIKEHTYSIR